MKGFWDSSAIVPLCLNAPNSQKVRFLWRNSDEKYVSWFLPVEVMSALARAERSRDITTQNRLVAEKLFKSIENNFIVIHSEQRVAEIARTLPVKYGLTALDSLQLASALLWCNEFPKDKDFISADSKLSEAAKSVGFTTHDLS